MRHGLLLLVLLPLSCLASDRPSPDVTGYQWKEFTPAYKLGYVDGYTTAASSAQTDQFIQCLFLTERLKEPSWDVNRRLKYCKPSENFTGITMGQFVDGIDIFFSDYRNKTLDVAFAFQYVRDELKGKSKPDLEAELTLWRRCTADSTKCTEDISKESN